jgi:plastocyanin
VYKSKAIFVIYRGSLDVERPRGGFGKRRLEFSSYQIFILACLSPIAMKYGLTAIVAGAILLTFGGLSAYGQEVRGQYIVDIPAGAYQAGEEHYVPADIAIPVGTTIAWFNDDPNQQHTVTSGTPNSAESGNLFDSGVIAEGAFFQYTFDAPGEFMYYCTMHPGMIGNVLVNG